jgi:hypothetical protein
VPVKVQWAIPTRVKEENACSLFGNTFLLKTRSQSSTSSSIQEVRSLLTCSSTNLPEVSSKAVLGSLVPVFCNVLLVWEVFLFAFCHYVESNYCYISKFCPIQVLFLVLSLCFHFFYGPSVFCHLYHESHFRGHNFGFVLFPDPSMADKVKGGI